MAFVKPFDYISKGKLYTMLMDGRETGKTTGTIKGCIERFLQSDGQYVTAWVRRWKSDTQDAKRGFFAKILENDWFPDHKFSVKNNIGYIDDTAAFYFLTLSVNARTRGGGIPHLKLMVFDEFLIDPRISRYIGKDEPAIFDSLFDTYARPRTTSPDNRAQALFLANTFTTINPYFLYHNIKFNKNQKVFQNKFIYAEKLHTIVNREPSEWELFTSGKSYGDHANDAKFILDDNSMIRKLPAKTQPLFIFLFNGKTWGAWRDTRNGDIYISEKHDKNIKPCFYLSREDRTPAMLNIRAFKRGYFYNLVAFCQSMGCLWFTSLEAQYVWDEISQYLNIT